jgi:hypothetical protein
MTTGCHCEAVFAEAISYTSADFMGGIERSENHRFIGYVGFREIISIRLA